MGRVLKLLEQLKETRLKFAETEFLAPCVKRGQIRTCIDGLVYDFEVTPHNFTGWGVFKPVSEQVAKLIRRAKPAQVGQYLRLFPAFRVRFSLQISHSTWLAYPANESDVRQRLGSAQPLLVRLVEDGMQFDLVVARWDGTTFWFEEVDRKESPQIAEKLRAALNARLKEPVFAELTPEMRACYSIARSQCKQTDEERLQTALGLAGGVLESFIDREDHWNVFWKTSDGIKHTSAISKKDLSVISAGICLSDRDSDFDLQSLVRVVELYDREGW